ncbi:ATP-binding protein [Acuticoccus sp.]|uniref:ATP-binding protein n=1 Tax=Acuticoccus sp. TaxID=1904378 RepID=UPI003B52D4AE
MADHVSGAALLSEVEAVVAIEEARGAMREADRLADQSLAEASRVARHVQLVEKERRLSHDILARQDDLAALRTAYALSLEEAAAPFRSIGVDPPPDPTQMVEWRRGADDVRKLHEAAQRIDDRLAALSQEECDVRTALGAIADKLAMAPATLPVAAFADKIEGRIAELEEAWAVHRAKAALRRHHEAAMQAATETLDEVATQERAAAGDLAVIAGALGARDGARWEEVVAVVALWRELPGLRALRERRADAVEVLRTRCKAFETKVAALSCELGADDDLTGLGAGPLASRLHRCSGEAATAKARQEAAQAAVAEAEGALGRAREACDEVEVAWREALRQLPQTADPTALVNRLRERDGARAMLHDARRRFGGIAPGVGEAAVRAELAWNDAAAVEVELTRLGLEAQTHADRIKEHYADFDAAQREAKALAAAPGAEDAAFAKNAAATEMADIARRWTVLRLASTILKEAVERQRKRHSAPLLERAGGLFAAITNHAFDGLTQRYGEGDVLQLLAVRRGEPLPIAALSDGTRDQLYLALRLAFVEDYATRNEPAPFIGDDLFQTFDDDRTAAGLAALAEIGGTVQPILFAHHKSVVEIARGRLGNSVDVIALD